MLNFTHPIVKTLFALLLLGPPMLAQPRIAHIEIFGASRTPRDRILRALAVKPGGVLPPSKGDLEEKLEGIDGVVRAWLEAWCCAEDGPILYAGIEERGGPRLQVRTVAEEELALPEEILAAYAEFSSALSRAVAAGDTEEDLSAGHSLMENLPCRLIQQRFLALADLHAAALRQVVLHAADPGLRAVAAYVYGYAPDKRAVAADLQLALQDPEPSVRANAARALRAIAVYARLDPAGAAIRLTSTWFVEMLNSIVLSDRLEAARSILYFLDGPGAESTAANLKERALPALFETANWRHLPHALPAFLILGRLAGLEETATMRLWIEDRTKGINTFRRALPRK